MKRSRNLRIFTARIIDYALFLGGCFLAGGGLALAYRFPRGRESRNLTLLGLDRHELMDLHLYVGIAMVILVLVHLALHWKWLKSAMNSMRLKFGWALLGIGVLVLLFPLLVPVS